MLSFVHIQTVGGRGQYSMKPYNGVAVAQRLSFNEARTSSRIPHFLPLLCGKTTAWRAGG